MWPLENIFLCVGAGAWQRPGLPPALALVPPCSPVVLRLLRLPALNTHFVTCLLNATRRDALCSLIIIMKNISEINNHGIIECGKGSFGLSQLTLFLMVHVLIFCLSPSKQRNISAFAEKEIRFHSERFS